MHERLVVMVNKPDEKQLVELAFSLDMVRDVYGTKCPEFTRYVCLEVAVDEKTAKPGALVRYPARIGVGAPGVDRDKLAVEGMRKHATAWWVHAGDYDSLPPWAVTHVLEFLKRPENAARIFEVKL